MTNKSDVFNETDFLEKTSELLQGIDKIQRELTKIQEQGDEAITPIKEAFAEGLSTRWADLAGQFANLDQAKSVEMMIATAEEFLADFHKVVLEPHRTRLSELLNKWLATWITMTIAWEEFLNESSDRQLAELDELLSTEEVGPFERKPFKQLWHKWVDYQVRELKEKQRSYEVLKNWITQVNDRFDEITSLDVFFQDISDSFDEHSSLKLLQQQWFDNTLAGLAALDMARSNPGFDELLTEIDTEWDKIQALIPTLKIQLQLLGNEEIRLVEKEIKTWQNVGVDKLQALISQGEHITRNKNRFDDSNTPQLTSTKRKLLEPHLECLAQLTNNQPSLPNPTSEENLATYLKSLTQSDTDLTEWLHQFEEATTYLQQEIRRWKRLPPEHKLTQKLVGLETTLEDVSTLGDIIQKHNDIVKVTETVKEALEKELSEGERNMLDIVLEAGANEQGPFPVTVIAKQFKNSDSLKNLLRLSEKNFISLNITVR